MSGFSGGGFTPGGGGGGSQGPQGAQGAQGAQGSQGFQGTQGSQGNQGFQGFQGTAGAQGAQGAQGFQGAAGSGGLTSPYPLPTGAIAESVPHALAPSGGNTPMASGTLFLIPLIIPTGSVIGHLRAWSGSVGSTGLTHSWAALFDNTRAMLAVSADSAAAIAATTKLNFAIATIASGASSTFTTTYTGLHYVGFCFVATAMPNMYGPTSQAFGTGPVTDAPSAGSSTSGLTGPPAFAFTAAAITPTTIPVWASVDT